MSRKALLTVSLILIALPSPVLAAKFNKVLDVGTAAPDWKNLPGTDDKQHSLADYKDAKFVVLVFTCNRCSVAKAYEDRLVALQKEYSGKGVQVVAINCNTDPADVLDKMKERAADKQFNFPYLYDESQQSGRGYGATVTPHVYVLDGSRKIAYMGAIDDNMDEGKVKDHYLRDALDALIAGNKLATTETRQVGCGIAYQ